MNETNDPIDRLTMEAITTLFTARKSERVARQQLQRSLRSEVLFLLDGKFFVAPRETVPCCAVVNGRRCGDEIPIIGETPYYSDPEPWRDVSNMDRDYLKHFTQLVEHSKGRLRRVRIEITLDNYLQCLREQRCPRHVGLECESLPTCYRFIGEQPEA